MADMGRQNPDQEPNGDNKQPESTPGEINPPGDDAQEPTVPGSVPGFITDSGPDEEGMTQKDEPQAPSSEEPVIGGVPGDIASGDAPKTEPADEDFKTEPVPPQSAPAPAAKEKPSRVQLERPTPMPTGQPQAAAVSETAPSGAMPAEQIPTYLFPSILVTICCCGPLGIPAIICAAMVNSRLMNGDVEGARRMSRTARNLCVIALVLGIIFAILSLLGFAFGVFQRVTFVE